MKNNVLSKILISVVMVGVFLLPFGSNLGYSNGHLTLADTVNKAYASYVSEFTPVPQLTIGTPGANSIDATITISVTTTGIVKNGKELATAHITGLDPTSKQPVIVMDTPGLGYKSNPSMIITGGTCSKIGTAVPTKYNQDGGITEITASGWTCTVAPNKIEIASSGSMYSSYGSYDYLEGNGIDPTKGIFLDLLNKSAGTTTSLSLSVLGKPLDITQATNTLNVKIGSDYLSPKTDYNIKLRIEEDNSTSTYYYPSTDGSASKGIDFTTPAKDSTTPDTVATTTTSSTANGAGAIDFQCGIGSYFLGIGSGTISGCIASLFYIVFQVTALVMKVAAYFLDFMIYYSTNSSSYKNDFIQNGWGAIRDVTNILFIVGLLYIAIETILGLAHSKKIIGFLIIAALLVNFSLFFTEVVIDASNILAKVFYNGMTSKDNAGNVVTGDAGQKSISMGLVDKFNPQNLISNKTYHADNGVIIFILVTSILIGITIYTAYMFFTVGLLFVGRVVMLWVSMIFAPLAFASFGLPFNIPKLGFKDWWKELSKNAFLAPIFVFFLYIIVMFAGFLSTIVEKTGGDSTDISQKIMFVLIPFFILYVFIMKAKEIAIEYSGELGAQLSKAGQSIASTVVGGAVVGGLGLAAAGGRATIGKLGSKLAKSDLVKDNYAKGGLGGWAARRAYGVGKKAETSSFDVRGIKAVGGALAGAGMTGGVLAGALAAQQGGIAKSRADKMEKRKKIAQSLAVGPDEKENLELRAAESQHQELLANGSAHEIGELDKQIKVLSERSSTASRDSKLASSRGPNGEEGGATNPATGNTFADDAKIARDNLADKNGERLAIKNASTFLTSKGELIDHTTNTSNKDFSETAGPGIANTYNAATYAAGNTKIAVAEKQVLEETTNLTTKQAEEKTKKDDYDKATAAFYANTNPANIPALQKAKDDAKVAHEAAIKASTDAAAKKAAATTARDTLTDTSNTSKEAMDARAEHKTAKENLTKAKDIKDKYEAKEASKEGLTGNSINHLEDKIIPDAHHHVDMKTKGRQREFADYIESSGNLWTNGIFSLGQHSVAGAHQSAHEIRMGAKLDSGHGGKGEH